VSPEGTGQEVHSLARLVVSNSRILDRSTGLLIDAAGPGHGYEVLGGNQLSGLAIEDVEKSVLVGLHEHLAARTVAIGRFFNAGQACLAVKRVFVFDSVADEFIDKISARAKRLKLGRGTDPGAQMGPLHTEKQRAEIESQLADAVERGGKVVAGGKRPSGEEFGKGYFFEPTIVVDVPEGARVWTEETFGPLLPIMRVKDLDEALEKANASEFGLGSSIFTRDMAKAQRAIDELEAGYTWVNAVQIAHDELPFGGTKHSGYGKEHGTEVLDYYTEQKSVVVAS